MVAKLDTLGLLARQPDPDDRRSFLISVTDQGRAEMAANRLAGASWLADALASTMSTRELAILAEAVPLMKRLTDRPDQAPRGSDPEAA